MNVNGIAVNIMWKEIGAILIIVYMGRIFINMYIKNGYNRINKKFYTNNWNGLEEEIERYKKICKVFSNGPWNKNMRLIYNGLCVASASISLIRHNEVGFVECLNEVKKEVDFEMKPFLLALYYRYKQQDDVAKKYYNKYLICNHVDEDIKVIMEYLFCQGQQRDVSEIGCTIKKFQNPAILKLLVDNNFQN